MVTEKLAKVERFDSVNDENLGTVTEELVL